MFRTLIGLGLFLLFHHLADPQIAAQELVSERQRLTLSADVPKLMTSEPCTQEPAVQEPVMGQQSTKSQQLQLVQQLGRVVDLDLGESQTLKLSDGAEATVKLVDLKEFRDTVCFAVRRAEVTVEIDGQSIKLATGNYNLPRAVGRVQVDCPVTTGYNENGTPSFWGLDKAVRLRLWPAGSPLLQPGTFLYPVKQKWFGTDTQMANEPVSVDGGDRAGKRKIYYHSGLDIGGSEGLVEVVAATDSLVVSVGEIVLDEHRRGTPVAPRYDVVYLLDGRGWYYRYSHLKEIDKRIVPGRLIRQGDRVGLLGKEGGSGGWSHLHFEIVSRQPSGKWGTQEGYAFLHEAYCQQYKPHLLAVARPHHLIWAGESITLDGAKSWSDSGKISRYDWQLSDRTTASGSSLKRTYSKPGRYSEVLKITDAAGHTAYDFTVVLVADRDHPERHVPTVSPNFYPTNGIVTGEPITFKVRSFNTSAGKETWDFGDGSPLVEVQSDGNRDKLSPTGYAVTTHHFSKPGDYLVKVTHQDEFGVTAMGHLHVQVNAKESADLGIVIRDPDPWARLLPYFTPPQKFVGKLGNYQSPLQFADGRRVQSADDWQKRRKEIREQWFELLGKWPALIEKPQVEILESTRRDNFMQHRIRFQWTPHEFTTAYLLVPDGTGKRPAIVTVYYEPETAVGLKGELRDFAYQLARRGFVTLSIGTTEASEAKTYSLYHPSIDQAEVQPLSMLGYAAANAWYVLASRPEVDESRIGIVGHSFGGKWALFAGCLFDRFAAVAVSDPGIMFDTHPSVNYWEPWYLGWHPRPWRPRGLITAENPAQGLYPKLMEQGRDLHELQALLAPRPYLVSGGEVDPPERWLALNHLIQINDVLGQKHRVGMTNRPAHAPNPDSNAVIYAFFEHFLGPIK